MRFAIAVLLLSAAAHANPKTLPFTYGTSTTAPGGFELEQYVDLIPIKVERELGDGSLESTWAMRFQLQTELEYGLTDRVELGFYLSFIQGAAADGSPLLFQGIKQRVRWRLSDEDWPIDLGLYFEIAEFYNEIEFEEKILLQRRFGPVVAVANLWVEQEYYFSIGESRFVYNPTVGVAYQPIPGFSVGLEYWARGRFDSTDSGTGDPIPGTRHYIGPALQVAKGEYWLALGAYLRVDNLGETQAVGDPYGRLWVRVIAGIGL